MRDMLKVPGKTCSDLVPYAQCPFCQDLFLMHWPVSGNRGAVVTPSVKAGKLSRTSTRPMLNLLLLLLLRVSV